MIYLFILIVNSAAINLVEIRNLYENAANSQVANAKLIRLLGDVKSDNALLEGYKGAALMMEANHVFSPITKLSRFKKGKQLIENAIKLDSSNVELRYIRLTIQTNVPGFLGYSKAIEADKSLIIRELDNLKDNDLRKRMVNYLVLANICTMDELKKVNTWKSR